MKKIGLFIIDDDEVQIWIIKRYFYNNNEIEVLYSATDGEEGFKLLEREISNIDILLLDLMMPVKDGFSILRDIKRKEMDINTIVLSSTDLTTDSFKLGIKYFFNKPVCLEKLKNKIKELCIKSNVRDIDSFIIDLLHLLGVPSNMKGYLYIKEAINIMYHTNNNMVFNRDIYPLIADKYNTTISNVERSIRHAIEICILRCDTKIIERIFGNTIDYIRAKPTNKEFIYTLLKRIEFNN